VVVVVQEVGGSGVFCVDSQFGVSGLIWSRG